MKVSLVVVQGKPEGMTIPVKGPRFAIGRDPKCNLRPNNDLVSKVHCVFEVSGDKLFLSDLDSTNGTFVNGDRLKGKTELHDGDLIKVGALVLSTKMEIETAVANVPAAAPAVVKPGKQDDDDVMQWLLGDREQSGNVLHEPSTGSTIMDMQLPDAETASMPADKNAANSGKSPYRPKMGGDAAKGNTAEAASALLSRYLVRKRS